MIKIIFFLILSLVLFGCNDMNSTKIIDKEFTFNFKGQVNLYPINNKKNIIKKFYEFSNHEYLARQNVKIKCLNFIKTQNLKDVTCKYMGTRFTEKILTSLD
tara:strand:+ start:235 stop:540 length:306 start_codon:yes stop_codon:yes gene_type:complete